MNKAWVTTLIEKYPACQNAKRKRSTEIKSANVMIANSVGLTIINSHVYKPFVEDKLSQEQSIRMS